MIIPDFMIHDKIEHLSFPVDLTKRLLWLARSFERANGYYYKISTAKTSYVDLTEQLFEATQLRGSIMLGINIWNNPIWIVMRFRDLPNLSTTFQHLNRKQYLLIYCKFLTPHSL